MAVWPQRVGGVKTRPLPLLLAVLAVVTSAHSQRRQTDTRFSTVLADLGPLLDVVQWHTIPFDFGGNRTKELEYRNSGRYDPPSIILIDADIIGGRVFVTTPLFKPGAPASFSVVASPRVVDPPLRPFPSWEAHATNEDALRDCSTQMVSVFRATRVPSDPNTVYLIDSGVYDISLTFEKLCPPKIVTIDVPTATILDTTVIDKEFCNSLYISLEVEETSDGRLIAYSADVTAFALAVTDLFTRESHRLYSQYYYPAPGFGVSTIGGVRSFLMDGLFALGVAEGSLYSWPFASNTLNKVATQVLRNASDEQILDFIAQTLVPGQRDGPSGAMAVDHSGRRMFFGIAEQEALYCWDTRKPYLQPLFRLLARSRERLQFFSGLKVLDGDSRLLVVTDRYQRFSQNILDQQAVNYRVMSLDISNLSC